MKWSWKIGQFAGIGVYIHATFVLIIAWVILTYAMAGATAAATLGGILFVLAIFGCVVLHEFGHALAAKSYGIKTRDITLLPIGGVARLERMPDRPVQELWVALAGPAVNVAIAALLWVFLALTGGLSPAHVLLKTGGTWMEQLLAVNITLVLFNLIPAFPMDGGRVMRALLAMRIDYVRATNIAAATGQALALVFGFVGLFTNPFLVFIALFVWIGAAQEAGMAQMKSALSGIPIHRAMLSDFRTLAPTNRLSDAVDLILVGSQQDFPVVAGERVVGILTRDGLMRGLASVGPEAFVADVMQTDFQAIDSHEMIEPAFLRMQEIPRPIMPVLHSGRLVGLLTLENLGELMMIQSALAAHGGRARA